MIKNTELFKSTENLITFLKQVKEMGDLEERLIRALYQLEMGKTRVDLYGNDLMLVLKNDRIHLSTRMVSLDIEDLESLDSGLCDRLIELAIARDAELQGTYGAICTSRGLAVHLLKNQLPELVNTFLSARNKAESIRLYFDKNGGLIQAAEKDAIPTDVPRLGIEVSEQESEYEARLVALLPEGHLSIYFRVFKSENTDEVWAQKLTRSLERELEGEE